MTYIVIEGVIGVGKTAPTRLLGEQFGVPISKHFKANMLRSEKATKSHIVAGEFSQRVAPQTTGSPINIRPS
jgi:thymidylate kinase